MTVSEVKRYWVPNNVLADQSGWHHDDNEVVLAGEHDVALNAAQSELAALREELAMTQGLLDASNESNLEWRKKLTAAEQRNTFRDRDAGRYRKLQLWMASNVKEGWAEVEKMGGICAWMSCDDMDEYLDLLPDCNVGLCAKAKPTESGASE